MAGRLGPWKKKQGLFRHLIQHHSKFRCCRRRTHSIMVAKVMGQKWCFLVKVREAPNWEDDVFKEIASSRQQKASSTGFLRRHNRSGPRIGQHLAELDRERVRWHRTSLVLSRCLAVAQIDLVWSVCAFSTRVNNQERNPRHYTKNASHCHRI